MTYYAVTNDPNELMHFGILGMKWGVRRTPQQLGHPRHTGSGRKKHIESPAYKKAQDKLSQAMRNGINRTKAKWNAYNSPAAKEARFMKRAMQKARTGTLKYGKLTDDQVRQVTQRLALEQDARRLGNTEQPKYSKRIKTAIGEGVVRGIGMGTASYIDARMKGRGETTASIKRDKRMSKYESNQRLMQLKARNKVNQEYYEQAERRGYQPSLFEEVTQADRAKQLRAWNEDDRKEAERTKRQNEYYDTYMRTAAANRAKNRVPDKNPQQNNNGNNGNNGNGQQKPQMPVSINVYNNSGYRTRTRASNNERGITVNRRRPRRGR